MNHRSKLLILAVAVATTPVFAAPLAGTAFEQAQIEMEIQSCLAEVGSHADYEGATRVLHEVTVSPRRSLGHRLDIRTSIYAGNGEDVIRAYTTRCLAYRDNSPAKFRISETDSGA